MNKKLVLSLFLSCLIYQCANAQGVEADATVSDKAQFSSDKSITALKLSAKGHTVLIEIHTAKVTESDRLPQQPKFSELAVKRISITVDGKNIPVPKSAVDYLVDVNRCSIKQSGRGWSLNIDGRDGSYAYLAVIGFDRTQVHRRALYSDINRSRLMEETRYMPPEIID